MSIYVGSRLHFEKAVTHYACGLCRLGISMWAESTFLQLHHPMEEFDDPRACSNEVYDVSLEHQFIMYHGH